jgi:hypothetical protein
MVVFLALITALVNAQQTATETKSKGSAKARDVKLNLVWVAMRTLIAYVEGLAAVLDVDAAAALIQSAGLLVAAASTRHKAVLAAVLTPVAGLVVLNANASALAGKAATSRKLMFNWQVSQDAKTWTDLHSTTYASTEATGLTALTTYYFRVSVTVGKVAGPWSQPVSILVTH